MRGFIEFRNIDYFKKGRMIDRVAVEMELDERNDKKVFSVLGYIWNSQESGIVCGGQCLDELVEFLGDDTLFMEIHRLWKHYHISDFHTECEHQSKLGWDRTDGLYVTIPEDDINLIEQIITTGNL